MNGLFFTNKNTGEHIDLMSNKDKFVVYAVRGLDPVDATISGERVVGGDGVQVTDVYADKRNIVISIAIRKPVDDNRQLLHSYFSTKDEFELAITVGKMAGTITGYVEKVETTENGELQNMQISLICPDPYFKGTQKRVKNVTTGSSVLPYTNNGAMETGFILTIEKGIQSSEQITIDIEVNEKHLVIKDIKILPGESILVDTREHKLERIVGTAEDIRRSDPIASWEHGNEWLKLSRGQSSVKVTVTGGTENTMATTLYYNEEYRGM